MAVLISNGAGLLLFEVRSKIRNMTPTGNY